uniref:Uncharacterized protein n=1 Tax=viral metagenome TaxID=1070528 RepID=A0A6C0EEF5_9ZZZZ
MILILLESYTTSPINNNFLLFDLIRLCTVHHGVI